MPAQIFLIAPEMADPKAFVSALRRVFKTGPVAALLLPQGSRDHAAYEDFVRAVLPVTQEHDCAVLLDGHVALAKQLGADGVHLATGIGAFKQALSDLKPDLIVGAGAVQTRHDAMIKGEAGADYLFFGDPLGRPSQDLADMAHWWTENFEIPCVVKLPDGMDPELYKGEFIAIGPRVWDEGDMGIGRIQALQARPGDAA